MKKAAQYLDLAEKYKGAIYAAKTSSENRFAGDHNDPYPSSGATASSGFLILVWSGIFMPMTAGYLLKMALR